MSEYESLEQYLLAEDRDKFLGQLVPGSREATFFATLKRVHESGAL